MAAMNRLHRRCCTFVDTVTGLKYKYQPSLTNPRDALHHGKRAANNSGRSVW